MKSHLAVAAEGAFTVTSACVARTWLIHITGEPKLWFCHVLIAVHPLAKNHVVVVLGQHPVTYATDATKYCQTPIS